MSLFVAVRPPADVAGHLAAAHSALPAELTADHPELRWVPPQNWHITLAFLGEVSEARRPELGQRLARAAHRHGALSLGLRGSGHFGTRVLYVGVDGDVEPLRALAASVLAAARRAKISVDDRPYRPHLTLARVRGAISLEPLASALSSYAGPSWRVDAFELMASHPAPEPGFAPTYTSVTTFALRPASRARDGGGRRVSGAIVWGRSSLPGLPHVRVAE